MGQLLFLPLANGTECLKFEGKIRRAHDWFFGIDYPYWFSLAQVKVESNCVWRTSLDGWGSVGYAQITPKFWGSELTKIAPEWKVKDRSDHFLAQAYILWKYNALNSCNKLYITYQCYNRSCKKVIMENINCIWEKGLSSCLSNPTSICVWKKGNQCLQVRTDCDINYTYSKKIYQEGIKYERWKPKRWLFW